MSTMGQSSKTQTLNQFKSVTQLVNKQAMEDFKSMQLKGTLANEQPRLSDNLVRAGVNLRPATRNQWMGGKSDEKIGGHTSGFGSGKTATKFSLGNLFGVRFDPTDDGEDSALNATANARVAGFLAKDDRVEGVDADEMDDIDGVDEVDEYDELDDVGDIDDDGERVVYIENPYRDANPDIWSTPNVAPVSRKESEITQMNARFVGEKPAEQGALSTLNTSLSAGKTVSAGSTSSSKPTAPLTSVFSALAPSPFQQAPVFAIA